MKWLVFFFLLVSEYAQNLAYSQIKGSDIELNAVEVTGHFDTSLGTSNAASQGVVLGQTLRDQPLLRPGEAMETVPGLVVTQHSGDGKANQYFLRGYNLDHGTDFSTSIDGIQANMPTNAHGQGYSDLNYLIPELIDRIEYRKGTYFPQNGDFSSAGSADVFYVQKLERPFLDSTLGSFGYIRTLMAQSTELNSGDLKSHSSNPNGDRPILLSALELVHEDGPWQIKENLQKINSIFKLSEGNRANGWSSDFKYYSSHWNSTDQVPLELIQSGQLCLYCSMDPSDGGGSSRLITAFENHSNDDQGFEMWHLSFQRYRLNLWSNFTFYELRPLTGDQFEQADNRDILSAQWRKGWDHPLFNHDSSTEIGWNSRFDDIHLGLYNTQNRNVFQLVSQEHINEWMNSFWIKNDTVWSSWFKSSLGMRADHLNLSMTAQENPLNTGASFDGRISPKVSLILGPWRKTEFFFNAGNGFHSNDARGVINKIDPTTGEAASAIPALVGSFGKEIGLRSQILPQLQTSLALWSLRSDSELVYSADSGLGNTSANGASVRSGVEWNNHYVSSDRFFFDADFAWTHANYALMNDNGQIGNQIPNAVGKVALLRSTFHHLGAWTVGWETRFIGSYPLTQDGSQVAPAAAVSNLRVARELSKDMQLKFDVLNVFNRQYDDIAYNQDYQISPSAQIQPSGITVHPGEPRQLRVGLLIRF